MTTPNDQFADITNRGQEAVTTAVRTWADTVQSFTSKAAAGQSQLPDLQSAVDQYFDFVETVLTNQREFARQWAAATVNAFEGATEQAQRATQSVAAHTVNGTEAVVENASQTARKAAETTANNAAAARDLTNNN